MLLKKQQWDKNYETKIFRKKQFTNLLILKFLIFIRPKIFIIGEVGRVGNIIWIIIIINLNMYKKYSKEFYESERRLFSFFFINKKVISLVRAHVFWLIRETFLPQFLSKFSRKLKKQFIFLFLFFFAFSVVCEIIIFKKLMDTLKNVMKILFFYLSFQNKKKHRKN